MSQEVFFTLRLPKRLNEKVKAEAKAERRSKNDQIIRVLEERYQSPSQTQLKEEPAAELATAQ